jgi:hypothetical protein
LLANFFGDPVAAIPSSSCHLAPPLCEAMHDAKQCTASDGLQLGGGNC